MDFFFTVRLRNPKKDLQNCSREQQLTAVFFLLIMRACAGQFFKSFCGFPNRTVKMKIQKQISQR